MTLAGSTTVNCTSCGAGLDVLGGGRVMVHICPYCGAELDAQDNYKVLEKFEGMVRPESPFRIGMTGKIRDVDYTVIGTLEHTEHWRGVTYRWVDHQLYSPTHGYAWLTLEDGHLVFTRRYRRPVWMSVHRVETADNPPTVRIDGDHYRYYETTESHITFAEGEFTWAPRIGDRTTTVTAMSDDAILGFSETNKEREVQRSTLLDRDEVAAAFGVTDLPPTKGIHALTPYKGENDTFMRIVAGIALLACLVLSVYFDTRTGTVVGDPIEVQARSIPGRVPITIPDVAGPVRVTLDGTPYVEPTLANPPSLPVFASTYAVLYHPDGNRVSGAPSRASVTIGGQRRGQPARAANHTELIFPTTISGDYLLDFSWGRQGPTSANTAAGLADSTPQNASQLHFAEGSVTIRTYTGMSSGYWMFRLGLVFLLILAFTFIRRWLHRARRWKGSDWTSED